MISYGLLGAICVMLIMALVKYLNDRKANKEMAETASAEASGQADEEQTGDSEPQTPDAPKESNKELILRVLRSLQCDPKIESENDGQCNIEFEYQAERFNISLSESSLFFTLYDAFWYSFENKDIDQLSNVKKIINEINWNTHVNICYNMTDDNMVNVHTVVTLLCHEGTVFTFADYMSHILREFFIVHHEFFKRLTVLSVVE